MKQHHTEHLEGFIGKNADVRDMVDAIADDAPRPYRTIEEYARHCGRGTSTEDVKYIRITITVQEIDRPDRRQTKDEGGGVGGTGCDDVTVAA